MGDQIVDSTLKIRRYSYSNAGLNVIANDIRRVYDGEKEKYLCFFSRDWNGFADFGVDGQ
jgi:hypothetical protein